MEYEAGGYLYCDQSASGQRLTHYLRRSRPGRKGASPASLEALRSSGKPLKVARQWRGERSIPNLHLSGQWLAEVGFHIGDTVTVKATDGQISIIKAAR